MGTLQTGTKSTLCIMVVLEDRVKYSIAAGCVFVYIPWCAKFEKNGALPLTDECTKTCYCTCPQSSLQLIISPGLINTGP